MVSSNNLTSSELVFLEYSNISQKLLATSFISETHHSLNVIIWHPGAGQAKDSSSASIHIWCLAA
jgi:hypothetical protein